MNYVYFQNSAKGSDRIGVVAIGDKNWHLWRSNGAISDPLAPMAIHLLAPMAKAIAIGDNKMAPMVPLSVDTGSEITLAIISHPLAPMDPFPSLDPLPPMAIHWRHWIHWCQWFTIVNNGDPLSPLAPMVHCR